MFPQSSHRYLSAPASGWLRPHAAQRKANFCFVLLKRALTLASLCPPKSQICVCLNIGRFRVERDFHWV